MSPARPNGATALGRKCPVIGLISDLIHLMDSDIRGAALLSHLIHRTKQGTDWCDDSAPQIRQVLGIPRQRQWEYRRAWVEKGWITQETSWVGEGWRLRVFVNLGAIASDLERKAPSEPKRRRAGGKGPQSGHSDVRRTDMGVREPDGGGITGVSGVVRPADDPGITGVSILRSEDPERSGKTPEESAPALPLLGGELFDSAPPEPSIEEILRGDFDGWPKAALLDRRGGGVFAALNRFSRAEWGKSDLGLGSDEDRQSWAASVRQGAKPSTIAKAVRGMRLDPFEKRGQFLAWRYLKKPSDIERFVAMYEAAPDGPFIWPKPTALRGMKEWRGFMVPRDFQPTEVDERTAATGREVFIVSERTWVDPSWDPDGLIPKQEEKYGTGFNRPTGARSGRR